jgi:hypothetical protein
MKRIKRTDAMTTPKVATDPRVAVVKVRTRDLMVVVCGDPYDHTRVCRSIVWVRPGPNTTPEEVAGTVEVMRKLGAVRVLAMPAEAQAAAVPASIHLEPAPARASIRAVVDELLAEVTEEPVAVRAEVERALSEQGL